MVTRRRRTFGLALCAVLLASGCDEGKEGSRSESNSAVASASATSSDPPSSPPPTPPSGTVGVLEASWTAPTTNADGSPLADLAFYRIYYRDASTPCPGSAFLQAASPTPSPQVNSTLTYTLTGLLVGVRYFLAIQRWIRAPSRASARPWRVPWRGAMADQQAGWSAASEAPGRIAAASS